MNSIKEVSMQSLESDNLKEVIEANDKVMVQFGASWCGNCRMVKPKFKRLGEANASIHFVYVDAEKFPESRKLADVSNLPTFAYFEAGQLSGQVVGTKFEKVEELLNAPANN
jgi:thiol-disulfide isomerase/thioredoxin